MDKLDSSTRINTSVGDGIKLYWDSMMVLHTDSSIFINHKENYYYCEKENKKNDDSEGERLSNFVIDPLYVAENENGIIKYILKFISCGYSKVVEVDGETLAINSSFKKFCMNSGKFNWRGKQHHLDNLVDFILACTTKEISVIPYIGWNSNEGIWFFPTHAYFQGVAYFPDSVMGFLRLTTNILN